MPDCSKLTETVFRRLVDGARKGQTRKLSAKRAGICERTFRMWMAKGRNNEGEEFVALYAAIRQAEAEACERWLDVVNTAAEEDWKAAIALMERRFPEAWATDRLRIRQLEREMAELRKLVGGGNGAG